MRRVRRLRTHLAPAPVAAAGGERTFTEADVLALRREQPYWVVVHGAVYDLNEFADEHPGGADILMDTAALDAGAEFDLAGHSAEAVADMAAYYRGRLVGPASEVPETETETETWRTTLTLASVEPASHDSLRLRFSLSGGRGAGLGLAVGQHVRLHVPGAPLARSYTPTAAGAADAEFVIKVYPGGQLTPHIARLRVGDAVQAEGPRGRLRYLGGGQFALGERRVRARRVGMVAGGTGVAPMLQVLRAAVGDCWFGLVLGNKSERDILLRDELERLRGPDFSLVHTLDEAPPGWAGEVGYVTRGMLQRHLPGCDLYLVCGPDPLVKLVRELVGAPVFAF